MKFMTLMKMVALGSALVVVSTYSEARGGAEHHEWPFQVIDYNDCTDEEVLWTVNVRQTILDKQSPSGRGLYLDNWTFEGILEGVDSGYIWTTKGRANYVETYSLEKSQTGGFVLIENSILKPVTSGAPRIKLDVKIRLTYNADGEPVVDRARYVYKCVGD